MLSQAHMRADARFSQLQRETRELVFGMANDGREELTVYAGKCDAGIPVQPELGEVAMHVTAHGDMMMHISIPDREFELETNRQNAYRFAADAVCFGADFAIREKCGMWGI